eukprot:GEMP01005134.1.p1 GENE.GEMP01005134.1~~GEMP01005134.1.p1  ORF type:complete len:1136 (+),score=242.64 GEMP01005134.1:181-3588(+)
MASYEKTRGLLKLASDEDVIGRASTAPSTSYAVAVPHTLLLQMKHPLDYTDEWPIVECTIDIKSFGNIKIGEETFEAEFVVKLDWLDNQLLEDIHFAQDIRTEKYQPATWVWENPDLCFNPNIRIDNEVHLQVMEEDTDTFPKIYKVFQSENKKSGDTTSRGVPWMTKSIRYRGLLGMSHESSYMFPLDVVHLPFKVAALPLPHLTSLGSIRKVTFCEPYLRYEEKVRCLKKLGLKRARERSSAHSWSSGMRMIADMRIVGFGAHDPSNEVFQVNLTLVRKLGPYLVDFGLQLVLVLIAAFGGCYVVINDDCMAHRFSITLTIILTFTTSMLERPSVISGMAFTLYDDFRQLMVIMSFIIVLQNLIAFIMCHGFDGRGLDDDERPLLWVCQEGFCGTTRFDCWFLLCFIGILFVAVYVSLLRGEVSRIAQFVMQYQETHANETDAAQRVSDAAQRVADGLGHVRDKFREFRRRSSGIDIADKEELDQLEASMEKRGDKWVLRNNVRLTSRVLKQGDTVKEFASVVPPSGSVKEMSFPVHVRVVEEGDAPETAQRFMVKKPGKSRELSAYQGQKDAVQILAVTPFSKHLTKTHMYFAKLAAMKSYSARKSASENNNREMAELFRGFGKAVGQGKKSGQIQTRLFTESTTCNTVDMTASLTSQCEVITVEKFKNKRKLDPQVTTFVLDIGDGVIGFYGFHENLQGHVLMDVTDSHLMQSSFANDFITPAGGAMQFADLLYLHFNPMVDWSGAVPRSMSTLTPSGSGFGSFLDLNAVTTKRWNMFVGCTGGMRTWLERNRNLEKIQTLLDKVALILHERQMCVDLFIYHPSRTVLAEYELRATEWLVQFGDLDFGINVEIPSGPSGQQFADFELHMAIGHGEEANRRWKMVDFVRKWKCLGLRVDELAELWARCPRSLAHFPDDGEVDVRYCHELCTHLRNDPAIMRAFARTHLFSGTLAVRAGTCEITVIDKLDNSKVEFFGLAIGDKTPMGICPYAPTPLWVQGSRITDNDLLAWRNRIQSAMKSECLPHNQRGFFVGIGAVFCCALPAGVAERILPRNDFLDALTQKLEATPRDEQCMLATVVLIQELVQWTLNGNAFLCAKRSWRVTQGGVSSQFVPTWSLGFWLQSSRRRIFV